MKLTELDPRWVGSSNKLLNGIIFGIGFECPHCKDQRLVVFFDPPIGDNLERISQNPESDPRKGKKHVWRRGPGSDYENLTLAPSIDGSEIAGHWHGFIEDGEIR